MCCCDDTVQVQVQVVVPYLLGNKNNNKILLLIIYINAMIAAMIPCLFCVVWRNRERDVEKEGEGKER